MTTIGTIGFLAGVTLVLFVASLSYIHRKALRRGFFLLALAIGMCAVMALTIYPALVLTHGGTSDAFRVSELDNLRAERDALAADLRQKARDNEALSKTSAFFTKLHKERLIRIADELETVKGIVLGPKSGMMIEPHLQEAAVTAVVDGVAGFDTIISELRRLKTLRVRSGEELTEPTLAMMGPTRSFATGTTGEIVEGEPGSARASRIAEEAGVAVSETLAALRKSLDAKMTSTAYQITPLDTGELIAGRTGRYYAIELRNQKSGNRFTFDGGKYTFQTTRPQFTQSFKSVEADVLRQLDGHVNYDLFVRGNADSQAYSKGQPEPGHEYRTISYLPSIGHGRYLGNLARIEVPALVSNAELPNLRGEYLKRLLAEIHPTKPATVLEGQIVKKEASNARFTEMILYVAW